MKISITLSIALLMIAGCQPAPTVEQQAAAYGISRADVLACRLEGQKAAAAADHGGMIYGSIMAAAYGSKAFNTCIEMQQVRSSISSQDARIDAKGCFAFEGWMACEARQRGEFLSSLKR